MDRTLLLVDDEENILAALTRLLRRDGYRIFKAGSGKEGLEVLAQNDIGVIISDQRMPEMCGTEFLSKANEMRPETVRIVLSGYTDLQSVTDAINRGAVYKFFTKPWEDDQLRANVADAFRIYELRGENIRLQQELQVANQHLQKLIGEKNSRIEHDEIFLHIAQETLEYLPLAVLGMDEDGMIVITNRKAGELLAGSAPGSSAAEVLPPGVLAAQENGASVELNGQHYTALWHAMGAVSQSRGRLLLLIPQMP